MTALHRISTALVALVVGITLGPAAAANVDPDDDGSKYVWAENSGWLNAQPQGSGGPGPNVSDFDVQGWMWAESVGWLSLSCENTGSCGSTDHGIKTGWCQTTAASPTGGPDLRAACSGDDVELSQLTLAGGATWHEIVRGSLSDLRSSGGDFTTATLDCAGENVTNPTIVVPGTPEPPPGDGY